MDLEMLRAFFLWCTIINGALLMYSFLVIAFAGEWVYRMHNKWYPISREAFYISMYGFVGLMKILVLLFNVVPYIALVIVG
jgi:hypothetical protein